MTNNRISFLQKGISFFLVLIMLLNPFSQALATDTAFFTSHAKNLSYRKGKLANGMDFVVVADPTIEGKASVALVVERRGSFEEEKSPALYLLLLHALFYGTQDYSRQKIIEKLDLLNLDIDPDSHAYLTLNGLKIDFSLSTAQVGDLKTLLDLLHQMAFQAKLSEQSVESARNHLIAFLQEKLKNTSEREEEEEKRASSLLVELEGLTWYQIRSFYKQVFLPEAMTLMVSGNLDLEETLTLIRKTFGGGDPQESLEGNFPLSDSLIMQREEKKVVREAFVVQTDLVNEEGPLLEKEDLLIDEKIYFRKPKLLENRMIGRATGIGMLFFSCVFGLFTAIPSWGLTTFIIVPTFWKGYALFCDDYLNDPYIYKNHREEDLKAGFRHAFVKGRLGWTLTPLERRRCFLKEHSSYKEAFPDNVSTIPMVWIANEYDLNKNYFNQMFTSYELLFLINHKVAFLHERNSIKMKLEELEEELSALLAAHMRLRDIDLITAQEVYDTNYFVHRKNELKKEMKKRISALKERELSDEDELSKEEYIEQEKQLHEEFDLITKEPAFVAGLEKAKRSLLLAKEQILSSYKQKVAESKNLVHFDERKEEFKKKQIEMIRNYSRALSEELQKFPKENDSIEDFLDLRGIEKLQRIILE